MGIKQIYSPMVDVSHEPRWGRISEAAGEDPYLGSVFAAARVKAAQGGDYARPDKVVTSVKHYAAYGQPEGGRDYNTTDMSEQRLRNLYLPPFKAAIDAGSDTVMCSFNAISGVPGCANRRSRDRHAQARVGLRRLHRERLHGGGGAARLPAEDARRGLVRPRRRRRRAGRGGQGAERGHRLGDGQHVHPRLRRAAARPAADLDGADRRRGAPDPAREVPRRAVRAPVRRTRRRRRIPKSFLTTADRAAARTAAGRSMVLLKNDGRRAAARRVQEDRRHRAARQERARHARPVVGPRRGRGRGHRLRRHQRPEPRRDVRRRAARCPTPSRRRTRRPTTARPTPASPRRRPRPLAPTRSCSRSARRAR